MKIALKPFEWGIFANEFSLLSSYGMIVGGFVAVANIFSKWEIGVYCFIAGLVVFLLEYPRSYRDDSKFLERRYQRYLVPYLSALGFYGRNYYLRSILYLCLSGPCFFLLPTFIGGACILTASFIYFIGTKVWFYHHQREEFQDFYCTENDLVYCNDICSILNAFGVTHNTVDWRLFIDYLKTSLKAVLLHNGNKWPSVPVAYATNVKETYEDMKFILEKVNYSRYCWKF